jgi:hypothetical protein
VVEVLREGMRALRLAAETTAAEGQRLALEQLVATHREELRRADSSNKQLLDAAEKENKQLRDAAEKENKQLRDAAEKENKQLLDVRQEARDAAHVAQLAAVTAAQKLTELKQALDDGLKEAAGPQRTAVPEPGDTQSTSGVTELISVTGSADAGPIVTRHSADRHCHGVGVGVIFNHARHHLREMVGGHIFTVRVAAPALVQIKEIVEDLALAFQNALDVPEMNFHCGQPCGQLVVHLVLAGQSSGCALQK